MNHWQQLLMNFQQKNKRADWSRASNGKILIRFRENSDPISNLGSWSKFKLDPVLGPEKCRVQLGVRPQQIIFGQVSWVRSMLHPKWHFIHVHWSKIQLLLSVRCWTIDHTWPIGSKLFPEMVLFGLGKTHSWHYPISKMRSLLALPGQDVFVNGPWIRA